MAAADEEFRSLTSAPWGPWGRSLVLGATALVAQVYLEVLNTTKIYNVSQLYKHLYLRDEKRGLLTLSNHISTVDDPSIFCAFLPLSFFLSEHEHKRNRWTMCAKEFCFKSAALGTYFQNGKVLPIERGQVRQRRRRARLHFPIVSIDSPPFALTELSRVWSSPRCGR